MSHFLPRPSSQFWVSPSPLPLQLPSPNTCIFLTTALGYVFSAQNPCWFQNPSCAPVTGRAHLSATQRRRQICHSVIWWPRGPQTFTCISTSGPRWPSAWSCLHLARSPHVPPRLQTLFARQHPAQASCSQQCISSSDDHACVCVCVTKQHCERELPPPVLRCSSCVP